MNNTFKPFLLVMVVICSGQFVSPLWAQGDLLIYPKRLVFDGTERAQDLHLMNKGSDTARYAISVIQLRMKDDGTVENISEPVEGQFFADRNFRFFPRSVVLAPGESQTVKVQLMGFGSLAAGEYRSHLYFRAEARPTAAGIITPAASSGGVSVSIKPVYGISIPVIVRAGASTTEITVSRMGFSLEQDSLPVVHFTLQRNGNMSTYGDVLVNYISDEGREIPVGHVSGLAVYTPNQVRNIKMVLDTTAGVDYSKGSLHVVYTSRADYVEKVAQGQIGLYYRTAKNTSADRDNSVANDNGGLK